MHIPKRAYGLLLVLWAVGFRVDATPVRPVMPRGEPAITADPCRPVGKRIYTTESGARWLLHRMMGLPVIQAEP